MAKSNRGFFSDPKLNNNLDNPNYQVKQKKNSFQPSFNVKEANTGGSISESKKGPVLTSSNTTTTTVSSDTTTTTTTRSFVSTTTTTTTTVAPTTTTTTSTTTTTTTMVPVYTLYMGFATASYVYGSTFSLQTNCTTGSQNSYLPPDNIVIGTLVYIFPNWPTIIQPGWLMEYAGVTYSIYGANNDNSDYSHLFLTDQNITIPACSYITIIPS